MNSLVSKLSRINNHPMDVLVFNCVRCNDDVLLSAKQRADSPHVCETCRPILGERPSVEYDSVCYVCGDAWCRKKEIICASCLASETDTSRVH